MTFSHPSIYCHPFQEIYLPEKQDVIYVILLLKNFHWLLRFKLSFHWSDLINITTSTEQNLKRRREREREEEERKPKVQ